MNKNVNCIYNNAGAWCTNENVKRSLFGIGARCCVEFNGRCDTCVYKVKHERPAPPPQPTTPKVATCVGTKEGAADRPNPEALLMKTKDVLFHHQKKTHELIEGCVCEYFEYKYNTSREDFIRCMKEMNNFKLNSRFQHIKQGKNEWWYDGEVCFLSVNWSDTFGDVLITKHWKGE